MAKLYFADEVKKLMDDQIQDMTNILIESKSGDTASDVEALSDIRKYREFANEIYEVMLAADRKEAEEKKAKEEKGA